MNIGYIDSLVVSTALPSQQSPLARIERHEELSKVQIACAHTSLLIESMERLMVAAETTNPAYQIQEVMDQATPLQREEWKKMGLINERQPCPSPAVVLFTYAQLSLELARLLSRERELKCRRVQQIPRAPAVVVEQEMPVRPLRRSSSASELTSVPIVNRPRSHSFPVFPEPRKKLEKARLQLHVLSEGINRAERLIAILVKFDVVWEGRMQDAIKRVFNDLPVEERSMLQSVGLGVQKNRSGIFTYPTAAGITESLAQYEKELQALQAGKALVEEEIRQLNRSLLSFPFTLDALKSK